MEKNQLIKAKALLDKYAKGTCTHEEAAIVERWYASTASQETHPPGEPDYKRFDQEMVLPFLRWKRKANYRALAAASVLVGVLTFALYTLFSENRGTGNRTVQPVLDLPPGGNKATLVLGDGKRIPLSGDREGIILTGKDVLYANGDTVFSSAQVASSVQTLHTPIGGQYQLRLPDGSKVWLNATSSITYSSDFGERTREVEISGEVFFDVKTMVDVPFIVKSGRQEILILGTRFNVNAYADEDVIRTTLQEGSIRVNYGESSVQLKPGQQSVSRAGRPITVTPVTNNAFAWMDSKFDFNNTRLPEVIRQLSRWYGFETDFSHIPDIPVEGVMSSHNTLNETLRYLEMCIDKKLILTERRQLMIR